MAAYTLTVTNDTKDLVYVTDASYSLARAPDPDAFILPGQSAVVDDYARASDSTIAREWAAGASFVALRFVGKVDDKALFTPTFRDLVKAADSVISVIYGGNAEGEGGPVQVDEQAFTDGPTTVVMDTRDGYAFQGAVTDTTRVVPSTSLIVAAGVLAVVAAAAAILAYHFWNESRIEAKAMAAAEPEFTKALQAHWKAAEAGDAALIASTKADLRAATAALQA